ncbi:MAG: (d)CMP kinase [Waddliaceae bacterium]
MIITIDGPVGTGKSTIAKKLSSRIQFIYFDTGAMYRTLTYALIKNHIDYNDKAELRKFLDSFVFDIKINQDEKQYFWNEENVTREIRSPAVTQLTSKIAAIQEVRETLVDIQRKFSEGVNAVFEGRDMGTVVFPDAEIKVFLTGRPDVRAERRYKEMLEKFPEEEKNLTFENVLKEINQRDTFDTERKISPLRQHEDALVVDTSDLTVDEIIDIILEFRDTKAK